MASSRLVVPSYETLGDTAWSAFLAVVRRVGAACYGRAMTYATIGTMGVKPGERDTVIEIMTRHNAALRDAGCLVYEVGGRDDDPDTVYVAEVWESEEAHAASLELDEVKAVISDAMPHLTGDFGGYDFAIAGSPLRD